MGIFWHFMNKTLLAILRTSLWGEPLNCNITVTQTLLKALHQQCLEPLVAQTLLKLQLSEGQKSFLLQLVAATMKQHLKVNAVLKDEILTYKNKGFNPILLKGQGCAYYYPNPVLRPTGDLDIYLGKQLDLKRYPKEKSDKHYSYIKQGVHIELHKYVETLLYPWYNKQFQRLTKEYMADPRSIQFNGIGFQIPPIQFNALMIFNHLWHHFIGGGIGLRQFVDLALILHQDHDHIDKDTLKADLQAIGLFKAWQIVGCVIVDALGLPEAEYPFYTRKYKKKGEALLRLVLKEGNLGSIHNWGDTDTPTLKKKSTALRIKLKRCLWISSVSKTESFNYLIFIFCDLKTRDIINLF